MLIGNNITIQKGILGKDPELASTKSGKSALTVDIAVYQGKDHNEQPITEWFRWRMYGALADRIAKAHKGDTLRLIGRDRNETYTDSHGEKKWAVYKLADDGEVIPKRGVSDGIVPQTANTAVPEETTADIYNEDLPF